MAEGFENLGGTYEQNDYSAKYPGSNGDSVRYPGRHGGSSKLISFGSGNGTLLFIADAPRSYVVVGCAIGLPGVVSYPMTFLQIRDASNNVLFKVRGDMDRSLTVLTGANAVLCNTGSLSIPGGGEFFYLELKLNINTSTGAVTVRINGTQKATFSGNTGSTNWQRVAWGRFDNGGVNATDLYVLDTTGPNNDFLGDCRVMDVLPDSDGTDNGFTASAGSRYQCVDETLQNGDTDYVSSTTPGNLQTFNHANISTTGTIVAVIPTVLVRKDDAGSRNFKQRTRSGATVSEGPDKSINNSYEWFSRVMEVDPNTGSAWSVAAVNASEHGVNHTV
jgi:hypothetical protein